MKIQVLVAVVTALAGQVVGDTKVVSLPGYSYAYHSAGVPAFGSAAVHYAAAPQAVQYSVPHAVQYVATAPAVHAVQYAVPQAVKYAAAPVAAVRSAPMVYSAATYSRPAAAVLKKVDFDDDTDDVKIPLTYAGYRSVIRESLEDDDDWRGASPFGYSVFDDEDRFDFDDDRK
ncbi:uncharacterized protein LOC126983316 [Eriocheir sinensis]|uniref:uncharacterized protein LOC126983316 n=1 Tax=Eriocheir sinensis TaxID=95602 RepID=UPI0021C82246|nr:uncharacterized protein LOC126983316 [Eriocheir sinensis]